MVSIFVLVGVAGVAGFVIRKVVEDGVPSLAGVGVIVGAVAAILVVLWLVSGSGTQLAEVPLVGDLYGIVNEALAVVAAVAGWQSARDR